MFFEIFETHVLVAGGLARTCEGKETGKTGSEQTGARRFAGHPGTC
jgi:hypothetical protein